MSREDVHKLLGGYATGTLTSEERQALFEAALQDQELFDALAREQALREVLEDPAARAHLLAAIDGGTLPWYQRWWRLAPVVAMAAAVVVVAVVELRQPARPLHPLRVANMAAPAVAQPAPVLPPPPEMARAAPPALGPFSLPGVAPAAPPPPPPQAQQGEALGEPKADAAPAAAAAPMPLPPPEGFRPTKLAPTPFLAVGGVSTGAPAPPSPPVARGALAKEETQGDFARAAPTAEGPRQSQMADQSQALPLSGRAAADNNKGGAFVITGSSNAGLAMAPVEVRGLVTDASGAAVPEAAVEIESASTGAVVKTFTNERGEFSAPGVAGSAYRITASARGFRTATVSGVTPPMGMPGPVNLRLDVGASAESVTVTSAAAPLDAAAPARGAIAGRGGRGGAGAGGFAMKKAAPELPQAADAMNLPATPRPAHPDLQYRILRRLPGGDRVEVPAGGNVAVGATVTLQITPGADGYLRIAQAGGRAIVNRAVRRAQPLETPLPKVRKAGRAEFRVSFSRQPFPSKKPDAADAEALTLTLNYQ
jgi:hypothetical protein